MFTTEDTEDTERRKKHRAERSESTWWKNASAPKFGVRRFSEILGVLCG
jgi:hypothetical protein